MAIIVDKVQKKRDITLSCKDLIVQNGIKNLTILKITSTAGISKGSFYDYFKNKEEILFELVNILMKKHNKIKEEKLLDVVLVKDKVKIFFDFFYREEDSELREIYKDFIYISLITPSDEIIEFQTQCANEYYFWMQDIIQNGIDTNEIIPEVNNLFKGFFATIEGLFLSSITTSTIDNLEDEINLYIDTIFKLIEVKK